MANGSFCWPFVVQTVVLFLSCLSHVLAGSLPDKAQRSGESTTIYHHPQHQSRMQVFVQTPTELRLVIDGLTIQSAADLVDYALLNGVALQTPPLRFDPGEVDFGETEYGTAAQRRVTVHNPSSAVVHLLTITGSTAHYHCSFFEDNILFPGANTSFDVYFLPRERGNLSSVLEIHTSIGVFSLKLRGSGVESRYHMLPAINMKLPTNASFIYLMSLYNPFPKSIQIEEIFTSSSELHIELVTGNTDEDADLWHLQPYETRPILFLEFKGREATHFLAYVIIVLRISSGKHNEVVKLFIPVDFEITDGVGLFPASPILDFGIVSPSSPTTALPIMVWNGYSRPILVQNVTLATQNAALTVDFLPARLAPDYLRHQTVAFLLLNSSLLSSRQQLSGEISIVVKGNQNNTAVIPYRIRYISGNLQAISSSNLSFNCQEGHCDWNAPRRFISLVNRAKSQIILYSATVKKCGDLSPYQLFLEVQSRLLPAIFAPSQSHRDLFSINVRKVSSEESRTSRCGIVLTTNVGVVELPVLVWDGRLEVKHHFVPTSNFFTHDVSVIYTGNEDGPAMRTLSLFNPNPVVVKIRKFDATSPYAFARVLGVSAAPKGNVYTLNNYRPVKDIALPSGEIPVPPDHYAVVEFYVNATEPPAIDSLTNILMWVVTDQPNRTPIVGAILFDYGNYISHPETIVMDNCFPGRLCVDSLVLSHTWRSNDPYRPYLEDGDLQPHQLQYIDFLPDDTGITYNFDSTYIYLAEKSKIATLTYDAATACGDNCYMGLKDDSTLHTHWLAACALDGFAADIDSYLVSQLQRRWKDIKDSGRNIVNITITLLTAESMPHLIMPHYSFMQVRLAVPKLIHSALPLHFGVVEVGQFDMLNFTIMNPSFLPLAIQIVLLEFYPAAAYRVVPMIMEDEFDMLGKNIYDDISRNTDADPVFSFLDLNFTVNFNKLITRDPSRHSQPFPGAARCARRSITAVLRPNTNFTVHVRFAPTGALEYKSVIILRNNLTYVETATIRGQGGQGDLVLSDPKGRALDKVEIAYTPFQLSECKASSGPASLLSSLLSWINDDSDGGTEATVQAPRKPQPPYATFSAPSPYPTEPPFTMHRSLSLRNMGRLPVYVTSVTAFGSSSGLRLTDVSGVHNHVIPTNGTINFQIMFSPDFQHWRYVWTLVVNSTAGTVRYPVVVTLPPNMIAACRHALPRPDWETMLRLTILVIVIPNILGAMLFAVCDAYYITSVVRQLKQHISDSRRNLPAVPQGVVSGSMPASLATHQQQSQQSGKAASGRYAGSQKNDQSRRIQVRVSDAQSVIATIVSEPKLSRTKRIASFWRGVLSTIFGVTIGWLFRKLFASSPKEEPPKVSEPSESIADVATSANPSAQQSNDARRSKNGSSRPNRQRPVRMPGGFRRQYGLYGQVLDTNADSMETNAGNSGKSRGVLSTSGDDFDEVVRRKPSSRSTKLHIQDRHKSPGGESNKMALTPRQEVQDDANAASLNEDLPTGDESVLEAGPSSNKERSEPSNTGANVVDAEVAGAVGRGGGDGQSADDECSSIDEDDDEGEEGGNEEFEADCGRKPSPMPPPTTVRLSNTSDEEHENNRKSLSPTSSTSSESPPTGTAGAWLTSPSALNRQQKAAAAARYAAVGVGNQQQQQSDWHNRKQQRLSEQPPRLQRRHLQTAVGNPADRSIQTQPTAVVSGQVRTVPAQVQVGKPSLPVFYRGVVPTMAAPLQIDPGSQNRAVNSPYLIAEATMKRVIGSHVAASFADHLKDVPSASLVAPTAAVPPMHQQHSAWGQPHLGIQKVPNLDPIGTGAKPNTMSTERPSWFSTQIPSFPFSSTRQFDQTYEQQNLPATSPSSMFIPSLQFAESLLDEPDSTVNSPRNLLLQPSAVSTSQLATEPSSFVGWGSDPIWDPKQTLPLQNEIANPTWDNPWAADIVKALWGSPGDALKLDDETTTTTTDAQQQQHPKNP